MPDDRKKKTYGRTKSGAEITDELIDEYVAEAEDGYDLEKLKVRRGRPSLGTAPAKAFPVRLEPELRAALDDLSERSGRPAGELVREALRERLEALEIEKRANSDSAPSAPSAPSSLGRFNDLDRIERALMEQELDPELFERCAQDLLSELYPGLSAIPGGTDWGRDADLHGAGEEPIRLMVTKSREYDAIRSNMIRGLKSLAKHGIDAERVVLANPGELSEVNRSKLREVAETYGAKLEAVFDRRFFASKLRRDGNWRSRLLGLPSTPITLSTEPWAISASLRRDLPLVGREVELEMALSATSDVIFVGEPGCGKTRLLAELPGAAFVDPDAAEDDIAADIRWQQPRRIVLDDAASAPRLLRFLQRLRRQEPDVVNAQFVVACWPDEASALTEQLPEAVEIPVGLMERSEVDSIVQAMGVTGLIARHQILDQAEGRPGWAVALADLLLRSGWTDLVTGNALLGQVDGYLRRSQLSADARDLLAVIAALRGVSDEELGALSMATGIPRSEVGRLLRTAAQGGLLDVTSTRRGDGITRNYNVRPPMLADAIAAEHYFGGDVPLGDFRQLVEDWPERRFQFALTACSAASLGFGQARSIVDGLVDNVLNARTDHRLVGEVLERYLIIDEDAGQRVASLLAAEFDELDDETRCDGFRLQPIAELSHLLAARYQLEAAIELLLEMSLHDTRATNPHPSHPLRKLQDLCTRVHPDLAPTLDLRIVATRVLNRWLAEDDEHWRVWSSLGASILTPRAQGAFSSPGDARQFHLVETIVPPHHATQIHAELWPLFLERLEGAPSEVVAEMVDVVHEWLRVGGGFDRPFGQAHPDEAVRVADEVGRSMLDDLVELAAGNPGLIARISSMSAFLDVELPPGLTEAVERDPFFRDLDRRLDDWRAAEDELVQDLQGAVSNWDLEAPSNSVARLVELRMQSKLAGVRWPDRIWIACKAISELIEDAAPWVDAALELHLLPEAGPFIEKLVTQDPDSALIERCLDMPAARSAVIGSVLTRPKVDDLLRSTVQRVAVEDFNLLDALMISNQISADAQRMILENAEPAVRGAFAVAMAGRRDDPVESIPEDLWQLWLDGVLEIEPALMRGTAGHQLRLLFEFLAKTAPSVLEELVRRRLREADGGSFYATLGHDAWDSLHLLPAENRTRLLTSFSGPTERWILFQHLAGADIAWVRSLLDASVVTPEDVIGMRGLNERLAIDDLATLLVPLGVEPARIASLAFAGMWTGEESDRYARLVDRFTEYARQDDPSIAEVGAAGVEIFVRARDEALEKERLGRIRGEV